MTTSRLGQAIHQVCGKMLRGDAELNDGQLLESFLAGREPAALEALVGRHAPMVWGVCRRILSNHHDAEDAFQAAFLVLARKASSIKPRTMVGNWLFGVARQTALKARATTAKRRAREKQITPEIEPIAAHADSSGELSALLDDELTKLPDKYRAVLILCGLQGKSLKEAARRLDLPEGTVASRLARGRAMLAKRLVRHGLAVSGVSLAALQAQQSASAGVSAAAISTTIKAATAAGVVSANVAALTKGVLKAMLLTKLMKTTAAALVILGVLGAGVIGWAGQKPEPQPPAQPSTPQAKKDKAPEQKARDAKEAKANDDPDIRYQDFSVSGRAVDPDGKPVSGATIFLVSTVNSPDKLLGTATSDKDGRYAFKDAKLPYRITKNGDDRWENGSFEVFGKCPGRAFAWDGLKFLNIDPRFKDVRGTDSPSSNFLPGAPIEITLVFAPPKKIESRVVDEKGKPIAGVKLRIVSCYYVNTVAKDKSAAFHGFRGINQAARVMPKEVTAVTDAQGQFEFSSVPPDVYCWLQLEHPDYTTLSLFTSTAANAAETWGDGHPLKLPLSLTLHSPRKIKVQVRSKQDDKPLAGVLVGGSQQGEASYFSRGISDKEGNVRLELPPGKYHLIAEPSGESEFLPTYEDFAVEEAPAEQSITLRQPEGCVLILKAIDAETGKGVPNIAFYSKAEDGMGNTRVRSSPHSGGWAVTNEKGELRAVVQPGEGRYGIGVDPVSPLPDNYERENPEDFDGRKVVLPAGKTITETFKLRKKK